MATEVGELARSLFEAYEHERLTRGDFVSQGPFASRSKRPRRWTELPIDEQDCWMAAARRALKELVQPAPTGDSLVMATASQVEAP